MRVYSSLTLKGLIMYLIVFSFYKIVCVSDMFTVFAVMVYFILLKYMFLKLLARTFSFHPINLFCNVPCSFCCMFLIGLRKHLLLRLDKIIFQFTFFVVLDQLLLLFYCIACVRLYEVFYRVAFLLN